MNTQEQFVITVSREVGSGGRTIGRLLAEKLNVRYCDKELIEKLISQFGLSVAEIEKIKARKKNFLADLFAHVNLPGRPEAYMYQTPLDVQGLDATADEIFACEKAILLDLAAQESCVIAGRSAFFVLKDHPNILNVFIQASDEKRLERIMRRQNVTRQEAVDIMQAVDAGREQFVKRFAGTSRYDARNYDLVMNVDGMTEEEAVACILHFIEKKK